MSSHIVEKYSSTKFCHHCGSELTTQRHDFHVIVEGDGFAYITPLTSKANDALIARIPNYKNNSAHRMSPDDIHWLCDLVNKREFTVIQDTI